MGVRYHKSMRDRQGSDGVDVEVTGGISDDLPSNLIKFE